MKTAIKISCLILAICTITSIGNSAVQEKTRPHTHRIGEFEVSLLSDGQKTGSPDILIDATPEMLEKYTDEGAYPTAINCFLIRSREKTILIDTGLGTKLLEHLSSLEIKPEEIDIILLTHMHQDHIGGMLVEGRPAFPNADVYIAKKEYEHWITHDLDAPFNGLLTFVYQVALGYRNRIHLFEPAQLGEAQKIVALPQISAIAAYGHTPGHTMFLLQSNQDKLLVWGDISHANAIQIPCPQVAVTYDVDPKKAVESRAKVLDFVSQFNIPVAGMHIASPGMGNVKKDNEYKFIPLEK